MVRALLVGGNSRYSLPRNQTLIYSNILLTLNKLNLYTQILILILTIITPLKTNIFFYYTSLKVHCKSKSKYNPNPTWFFTRLHDPFHSSGPSRRHVQLTQTASLPDFIYKHYSAHITIWNSLGAFERHIQFLRHFTNTFAVSSSGQFLRELLSDEAS
jgi:hypothetical protein